MHAYAERLDRWSARREALQRVDLRWSWLRIGVFAVGAAVAWYALVERAVHPLWLLAPLVAFLGALSLHDRVIRRRRRAERAGAYYRDGLERIAGRWSGRGDAGERFRDEAHPNAADLDLFGEGSLFQRIDRARSEPGKRRLADWLREPADVATLRRRQEAVRELAGRLDDREAIAIVGEAVRVTDDTEAYRAWAAAPARTSAAASIAAAALGLANLVTLALWWGPAIEGGVTPRAFWIGAIPFAVSALLSAALVAARLAETRRVLAGVGRPAAGLRLVAGLIETLEARRFESARLGELHDALAPGGDGVRASRAIRALRRLVELHESRANMILHALGGLTLLGTQLALALERWRATHGASIEAWLEALAEFEAIASLATYAFERPDDPFPELREGGRHYVADGLGHPLIDDVHRVRNDLRLDDDARLYLVSGSNMSGKSTWLRCVGVNAVLAFAGAPVCATRMSIAPLRVGAAMRISDSLQRGLSHFYAEIRRLRELVDLAARPEPLLFLLDEILHGTNSRDRRVGAEALVRGLLDRGAFGLVTTHDLALSAMVDGIGPVARNVHFSDRLDGEAVVFDYRLRDGVVDHGNALALMRAIGLEV